MAELRFDVKANYEDIVKLRKECGLLKEELSKVTKSTDQGLVDNLTNRYMDASVRLKDLTQAASRAAYVMSSEFNSKMQDAAREVYRYELQIQATKDRIDKMKMSLFDKSTELRKTTDPTQKASIGKDINSLRFNIQDQNDQLKELQNGAIGARQALSSMRDEYSLYSGSAKPAKDATDILSDSMGKMVAKMQQVPTAGEGLSGMFQRVTGDARMLSASLLGGLGLEQLASTIFNTRSNFQQLEISFKTMLGSGDKATKLMNELIDTAAKTPFDMESITGGAKQLLAYGTEAKDVNKTLVQLGDIASGLNIPLGDLVYLYGTTVAQGRMFTMDLRQFMGRGIPMAEELGKILHQNTTEVQESVSKGKVTADIFKQAIENMTQAGGKFGGLMEQQSKALEGQWSNIGDSVSQMFNEIGRSSEGVFGTGLSWIAKLVDNWQEVIKVMGVAVATMGAYKASLMAAASIRSAEQKSQEAEMVKSIDEEIKALKEQQETNEKYIGKKNNKKQEQKNKREEISKLVADTSVIDDYVAESLERAVNEKTITEEMRAQLEAKRELLKEQQALTAQSQVEADIEREKRLSEVQIQIDDTTSTINGLNIRDAKLAKRKSAALRELSEATKEVAEAQRLVEETADGANLAFDDAGEAVDALEAKERLETAEKKVNNAQTEINTITTEQATIAEQRATTQKQLNSLEEQRNTIATTTNTNAQRTSIAASVMASVKNGIQTASTKVLTVAQTMLTNAYREATGAIKGMWAALMANPITGIISLVTLLASTLMMFGDDEDDISVETDKFGESARKTENKVSSLIEVMRLASQESQAYKQAKEELISIYEEYGIKCDKEKETLETLTAKHKDFTETMTMENAERERANALMEASAQYDSKSNELQETFKKDVKDVLNEEDVQAFNMLFNSTFDDEKIEKIRSFYNAMNNAKSLEEQQAYLKKYKDEIWSGIGTLDSFAKELGYSNDEIAKLETAMLNSITGHVKYKNAFEKAKEIIEKASESMEDFSDKTKRVRWATNLSKKSIEDLITETNGLIDVWNKTYHLDLKVKYDDSEIPTWMKSLSTDELKKIIARRQSEIIQQEQYYKDNKKNLVLTYSNGTTRTLKENISDVAKLNSVLQTKNQKTTPPLAEKKKGGKNRGDSIRNVKEAYDKSILDYTEKALQNEQKTRLELMQDGYDKEIEKIKQNDEKERKAVEDGIDKLVEARKKRDRTINPKSKKADEDYRKEVLSETAKGSDGKPIMGKNGKPMTIADTMQSQYAAIDAKTEQEYQKVREKYLQDMRSYFKDWGSKQQQRIAIEDEFNEKIKKAKNEWEANSLKEQKQKALSNVSYEEITGNIDWAALMRGVGSMSKGMISEIYKQLETYSQGAEFAQSDTQNKELVVSTMEEMRKFLGEDMNTTWDEVAELMVKFVEAQDQYRLAKEAEKNYQATFDSAKTEFKNGKITEEEFNDVANKAKELSAATSAAGDSLQTFGRLLNNASDKLANYTSKATKVLEQNGGMLNGIDGYGNILSTIKQGDKIKSDLDEQAVNMAKNGQDNSSIVGLSKVMGDGLNKLGKVFEGVVSSGVMQIIGGFAQMAQFVMTLASSIKSMVTGILDSFTELLSFDWLSDMIVSIMDSIGNLVNAIFDLPENIAKCLQAIIVNGVGGLVNTVLGRVGNVVTLGMLSSKGPASWFNNSNAEEVAKTIDRLTKRNEILTDSIDRLTNQLSKETGVRAIKTANEALDAQKEKEENLKGIAVAQMGYHADHKSFNKYWNISTREIDQVSEKIGRKWDGNLSSLNTDEINKVLSMPSIAQRIMNTGKGGYGKRVYDDLKEWADEAGKAQEIADTLNQALTQTTFDELRSSFASALMDMNKTAKDFSNDFSKMLMQAILQAKLDEVLGDDMKKFYEKWADMAKKNGGTLSPAQIAELKKMYEEMAKEGIAIRDEVAEITGYKETFSQSASSGAYGTMSQDVGTELNGRFTAVQYATEGTYTEIMTTNKMLAQIVAAMTKEESTKETKNTDAKEIRDLISSIVFPAYNADDESILYAKNAQLRTEMSQQLLALDDGRTILAQGLLYIQSIDERHERWNKPMLQAFRDIGEMKEKMRTL